MKILPRTINRRGIQIALGILWLLDGLLQLQPLMFTKEFASQVIAPAALGQPGFVTGPMRLFINLFASQPVLFNSLSALVQLTLGLLILWKPAAKWGLTASVVWGLFVWYIGEGLGGMASGQTLILIGAPGAALIYALLALGVMPKKGGSKKSQEDQRPAYWMAIVWAVLWLAGAIYQLLPGQNTVADISSMIAGNASGAPGWMASLDTVTANVISGFGRAAGTPARTMTSGQMSHMATHAVSGFWFILLMVAAQALIGLAIFIPGSTRKIAVIAGAMLSLGFWVVGQSMGAYFSGLATDPSTAPLFILLGIAALSCTQMDLNVSKGLLRVKNWLIGAPSSSGLTKA
jgi:hypothetical protein